ncbi:restriction endonuclease subunit S [Limosilactobacillus reuteri]|uniref:restriction endonuclease subunit S n=1 Tax=Limosilactobacillus reuteri TaxID=1598 RepID=UPI0029584AC6|nr:restriction endonuclease subunit S [Limosilactobacillus reuteri]
MYFSALSIIFIKVRINVKWEQHKLGEVAKVTMGQSPSSKNYTDNPNDYVLVQGNADLKSNEISPRVWTKEVTKKVHKGEFIMTVRAPVGYLATANMDAVIGRGVAAIDGNKYLYYLLQTKLLDRTWEKLSSGSTFESISSNDIKNLEIKVTETEEEKLIAKLMDTVTYFVTLQQRKLEQLKQLKRAMLQQLFADKNCKQPILRFKSFNDNWEERKLSDIANYRNGKAHEQYIDMNGIYTVVNSKFISTNGKVKKFSNKPIELLKKGEIAFVLSDVPKGKALAKAYLIDSDNKYSLNQRIAGITPSSDINSYFLYVLMNRNRYFLKFDDGVGQTNLSKKDIEEFKENYPLFDEQQKIANLFSQIQTLISLQQNKHTQLIALKKYLLQKLFI